MFVILCFAFCLSDHRFICFFDYVFGQLQANHQTISRFMYNNPVLFDYVQHIYYVSKLQTMIARIISLIGQSSVHKTSLTLPLLIAIPVPSLESEWSCTG